MKVLLSIRPEFVEQIVNGKKLFEYRKRIFKKEVESVIIYCTKPVGMIVGEFTFDYIISDTPQALWDRTHNESGISKDFFMQYFSDRETGYAIQIKEYREYENPVQPEEVFGHFVAPQSYRYVADEEWKELQLVL
ncbi:hypothetical protein [Paenibacillus dendritiformis]|uniref:ASCH domain-containing protein n=1 Tax=Paenibacillus dendritiformis C454 TaxID=1131935 RepID=H3SK87_9BACL|nr:hypothetical protein [Paenibacillus dendritiformis]EHQ60507.1 hypothetical protein PDENDC454_19855 [Paenibacillus dendritiformis C454]CAH8773159.1 hypothetical protein H7S4_005907 [Paenibacillus dendritiformis]